MLKKLGISKGGRSTRQERTTEKPGAHEVVEKEHHEFGERKSGRLHRHSPCRGRHQQKPHLWVDKCVHMKNKYPQVS